jgi:hypothetical protein
MRPNFFIREWDRGIVVQSLPHSLMVSRPIWIGKRTWGSSLWVDLQARYTPQIGVKKRSVVRTRTGLATPSVNWPGSADLALNSRATSSGALLMR